MEDIDIPTTTEQRHTEEMQDIIGAPPAWLLRWGITLFFLVLVLILSLSEVIRYPDVVKTQLIIKSLNQPLPVTIKSPGKLIELLVHNNQNVIAKQSLAIIESDSGKTILLAPRTGKLSYAGILHNGQELFQNQPLFHITSGNEDYFGELMIPQAGIGKVKEGQEVIIKLKSFAYEEYGMLHGTIKYIIDNPTKSGEFLAEVDFNNKNLTDMKKPLNLKPGMMADADIITQKSSLFKRLTGTIFKNISR